MTEPVFDDAFDLSGEADVLNVAAPLTPAELPSVPRLSQRVPNLVVCRESNEYSRVLMDGLVQQTLSYCTGVASRDTAAQIGLMPLVSPELLPPDVYAVPVTVGRARAVLFQIADDFYLYAMTSAARRNTDGDNDWTRMVMGVLTSLRPHQVWVASMSRLVRSFVFSGDLLGSIGRNVDSVWIGAEQIKFTSAHGFMMWSMLSTIAASERDLIVQRLTSGVVAKYFRGEWVKGAGSVPLGYRLDPTTKNLVPDPGHTQALRMVLMALADDRPDSVAVINRVAEMGISTPAGRARYGEHSTVADLRQPLTYLEQVIRWMDLYETGRYRMKMINPFPGAKHIAGLDVVDATDGAAGFLNFEYEWGRPDVPLGLVDAARAGVQARRRVPIRGAAAKLQPAHLAGTVWTQGDLRFWLRGLNADSYEIRVAGTGDRERTSRSGRRRSVDGLVGDGGDL